MWLRIYRLLVLLLIAWVIRDYHARQHQRSVPVALAEVAALLPDAASLRPDASPRGGWWVADQAGVVIGYAVRTMPRGRDIVGYAGPSDLLVVTDESWRVVGARFRSSEDTPRYVAEVAQDLNFLQSWTGMTATKASALRLGEPGFDAVAGATATSRAAARSVARTLAAISNQPAQTAKFEFGRRDAALVALVIAATAMSFGRLHGRRRLRVVFQVVVLAYFVFIAGDLLALKLIVGWAKAGVPWESAPGLLALLAAALLMPWGTGRPLYCLHVCPHGALQEWAAAVAPKSWRSQPGPLLHRWLATVPLLLVGLALAGPMLGLGLDLSEIEPFDAFNLARQTVGYATLAIALAGLALSFCVPKAYCKYGCPTGLVLEFARTRAGETRLTRRDGAALLLLAVLCILSRIR